MREYDLTSRDYCVHLTITHQIHTCTFKLYPLTFFDHFSDWHSWLCVPLFHVFNLFFFTTHDQFSSIMKMTPQFLSSMPCSMPFSMPILNSFQLPINLASIRYALWLMVWLCFQYKSISVNLHESSHFLFQLNLRSKWHISLLSHEFFHLLQKTENCCLWSHWWLFIWM